MGPFNPYSAQDWKRIMEGARWRSENLPAGATDLPSPPPLKDIFQGEPVGRLLDLLGVFVRDRLHGMVIKDRNWLGHKELLREFMFHKNDHLWVGEILHGLESATGANLTGRLGDLAALLRGVDFGHWPPPHGTWEQIEALRVEIQKSGPGEELSKGGKDVSSLGMIPKKRRGKVDVTSTEVMIVACLRKHHAFNGEGDLNSEPISRRDLARMAGVGAGSVSRFWKSKAKSIRAYRNLCKMGDEGLLFFLDNVDQPFPSHLLFDDKRSDRVRGNIPESSEEPDE